MLNLLLLRFERVSSFEGIAAGSDGHHLRMHGADARYVRALVFVEGARIPHLHGKLLWCILQQALGGWLRVLLLKVIRVA